MSLLENIEKHLDPKLYPLSEVMWNSLPLNSRVRFHSFFRHASDLKNEEEQALKEHSPAKKHFKEYASVIVKYFSLKFFFRKKTQLLIQQLKSEEVILLKTFSYVASMKGNTFKDPFFQSFTDRLSKERNHLVIVDPLMKKEEVRDLFKLENINILPWFSFLSLFDVFQAFLIQIKNYLFFPAQKSFNAWDKELKQEIFHPTTFHHLLFYFAFKRISKTFKVKRFITTFENNSWEKVVTQAFRENSQETKIIGYQHSVVPESTLGMRYLPWEISRKNLPDLIYTTGLETQNILQSFNPHLSIPIKALCALRYEYLYAMPKKNQALSKNILVALEAIVEASELINIVLELKDFLVQNDFHLTFRFHPAMTYEFFKKIVDAEKLESFASISSASLIDDLNQNDCVLYWGSTVSLESSFIGNALINFQSSFPLSHDPLYRCNHLKAVVRNSHELKNSLERIYQWDLNFINEERVLARTYIENYFHKPEASHLTTLLGFPS